MLDSLLDDQLSLFGLFILVVAISAYVLLENSDLFSFGTEAKSKSNATMATASNHALSRMFYKYNHESEKDWMQWIKEESQSNKNKALKLLNDHFDAPAKHWGAITLEALEAMPIFKEEGAGHIIAKFFIRSGKLWNEYRSIPNYYKKAAEVLSIISPQLALKNLSEEFDRRSSIQSELERKKIIIDVLPKLGPLGAGLIVAIITNNLEVFSVRTQALRSINKLEPTSQDNIILESLKQELKRFGNIDKAPDGNDKEILEDLFSYAAFNIAKKEFLAIFKVACNSNLDIHKLATDPLIKRIRLEKNDLGIAEIYAMTLLTDNPQNQLRRAIASIHGLESDEIESICITKLREDPISEEILREENPLEVRSRIPRPFYKEYESFKKLFAIPTVIPQVSCQKAYGGVLLTGNDEITKLYFAKAFARESGLNFGYINIANINGKEDYNKLSSMFTDLRKPYLIYITHPELMYPSDKSQTASYRSKFAQSLYIQALDTKSFLIGSINKSAEEIQSETTMMAISQLRSNFFSQVSEINQKEESFKSKIIEDCFNSINPHRLENKMELGHQLLEKSKGQHPLSFSFEALKLLSVMLLVYGHSSSVAEVEKVIKRFAVGAPEKQNQIEQPDET